jgi:hypothetical protein
MSDENEAVVMSARQAEELLGLPREVTMIMSGLLAMVPRDPQMRRVRRHVLLAHYCRLRGVDEVVKVERPDGGPPEVFFRQGLHDDLAKAVAGPKKVKEQDDRQACIVIALMRATCDDSLLKTLAEDALVYSSNQEDVNAEWERYEREDVADYLRPASIRK